MAIGDGRAKPLEPVPHILIMLVFVVAALFIAQEQLAVVYLRLCQPVCGCHVQIKARLGEIGRKPAYAVAFTPPQFMRRP
jgi:hypothetical protein